jgi:DNA polymerase/3'-5' exonuclease PolX
VSATNQTLADRLREAADLLEQQAANPFRVRAYREAAHTVLSLGQGLAEIHVRQAERDAQLAVVLVAKVGAIWRRA